MIVDEEVVGPRRRPGLGEDVDEGPTGVREVDGTRREPRRERLSSQHAGGESKRRA